MRCSEAGLDKWPWTRQMFNPGSTGGAAGGSGVPQFQSRSRTMLAKAKFSTTHPNRIINVSRSPDPEPGHRVDWQRFYGGRPGRTRYVSAH